MKQSTLVLKISFHLINIVLMGLCSVFLENQKPVNESEDEMRLITHQISLANFMEQHGDKCIYDLAEDVSIKISIIEYYPRLFREIRKKVGVTEDFLFKSFIPQHNI